MTNDILLHCLLYLNILSIGLGYIIGRMHQNNNQYNNSNIIKQTNNLQKQNAIKIDDKKLVVDINTKGLEKKYESLGINKQTENTIDSSINKLKNLKG